MARDTVRTIKLPTNGVLDKDRIGQELKLVHDFSDTNLKFGDYIRLKGLKCGDLIYLKDLGYGGGVKVILVGNATPYEGVTEESHNGWDWSLYNQYEVWLVYHLELEKDGCWLSSCNLMAPK